MSSCSLFILLLSTIRSEVLEFGSILTSSNSSLTLLSIEDEESSKMISSSLQNKTGAKFLSVLISSVCQEENKLLSEIADSYFLSLSLSQMLLMVLVYTLRSKQRSSDLIRIAGLGLESIYKKDKFHHRSSC